MTDTLTIPRMPSPNGTTQEVIARMITSGYGDGFKTSAADGARPFERTQSLYWEFMTVEEVNEIVAFLESHVGTPFYFRLPREQAPRTWVWTRTQRGHPLPTEDSFMIALEERPVF